MGGSRWCQGGRRAGQAIRSASGQGDSAGRPSSRMRPGGGLPLAIALAIASATIPRLAASASGSIRDAVSVHSSDQVHRPARQGTA